MDKLSLKFNKFVAKRYSVSEGGRRVTRVNYERACRSENNHLLFRENHLAKLKRSFLGEVEI